MYKNDVRGNWNEITSLPYKSSKIKFLLWKQINIRSNLDNAIASYKKRMNVEEVREER